MNRKLIAVVMALTASMACALPATAPAANDPQLTEAGSLVPAGAAIVGAPYGETYLTNTLGEILLYCSSLKAAGKVLKNSGGTLEGEMTTYAYGGTGGINAETKLPECTGSFGNAYVKITNMPLCIKSTPTMAEDEGQVGGGGCGTFENVKFTVGATAWGACEYETSSTIKGDFTTGGTQVWLTVRNTAAGSGSKLVKGSFLCPSSAMLRGSAFLKTENGASLTIS